MKNTLEENQTLEMENTNSNKSVLNMNALSNQEPLIEKDLNIEMSYGCSVCGMDEWCGTDGCPLDPQ